MKQVQEGAIRTAAQILFAYKFVEMLSKDFKDWPAFQVGLIDDKGKKLRKAQNPSEKAMFSVWYNLIRHLKRVLIKIPGGNTKIASFAAAFALLKEQKGSQVNDIIRELYPDWPVTTVNESKDVLLPGMYILNSTSPFYRKGLIHTLQVENSVAGVYPPVFKLYIDNRQNSPVYACESHLDRL